MCQLAAKTSKWIDVDPWEAIQPDFVPTAKVLDHFDREINTVPLEIPEILGDLEAQSCTVSKHEIAPDAFWRYGLL
jgi:hypothetical protein